MIRNIIELWGKEENGEIHSHTRSISPARRLYSIVGLFRPRFLCPNPSEFRLGFGIWGFNHTTSAPPVHQCKKNSPVNFFDITISLKGLKNLKLMACTSLQHSWHPVLQGVQRLLIQLWSGIFSPNVDGIQYPFNHLFSTWGDFVWHMKHHGTYNGSEDTDGNRFWHDTLINASM